MRKPGCVEPVEGDSHKRRVATFDEVIARRDCLSHELLAKSSFDLYGCWQWEGNHDCFGYGNIYIPKRCSVSVHVLSWIIFRGDPAEKLVLHNCDNPACWRPTHLYVGTHAENTRDMMLRGRHRPGMLGKGKSGVPYVIWSSRRGKWKFYKNDTKYSNTDYIESPHFDSIEEVMKWGKARGFYA